MKMLKSKNIRRICVLLAMLAPVVYLFGSLFSALTGAHGTEVFAEPVYVDEWIDVDSYVDGDGHDYRYVVDDDFSSISDKVNSYTSNYNVCWGSYYLNGTLCSPTNYGFTLLVYYQSSSNRCSLDSYIAGGSYFRLVALDGSQGLAFPWVFSGDLSSTVLIANFLEVGHWQILESVPSSVVPENAGAFSDYVFKNFFAKDNFLVQIGKDVLSDSPHGFVPFASFWKYLDNNMLHMGDMQLGLMGYGYVYYCCHVLLFDIAFILVTFFLDFIQKVNDKVVGGVD